MILILALISCKKDNDKKPDTLSKPEPELIDSDISEDRVLSYSNLHGNNYYLISNKTTIYANLKIEPGVIVIFKKGADLFVTEAGNILAEGTEGANIIFKGENESKGYWGGIFINNNNESNKLLYCNIQYAGNIDRSAQAKSAAVIVYNNARLSMQHCQIFQSGGYGMYIFEDAQLPEFKNNSIKESSTAVAMCGMKALGYFNGSNDFKGNNKDHIDTYNSQNYLKGNHTWYALNVPYRLPGKRLDIEGSLTIEAGTQFLGVPNSGIKINEKGLLIAKGTASYPIIFKGQEETSGYWSGFQIATDNDNSMEYVMIANAGGANSFSGSDRRASIEVLPEGNVSVSNCTISNGEGPAIRVLSGGKLAESGNNLEGGIEN